MATLPLSERRPAWRVLRAMERELAHQHDKYGIGDLSSLDSMGRITITGTLDLAALATATEHALRKEFGF